MTTAPATESILSVLPPAKAGVGSAVNDATREAGGTLGVAVLGSIFTSLYGSHLADTSFARLPHSIIDNAQNSIAAALQVVGKAPATARRRARRVQSSFITGFHVACVVGAPICIVGAIGAAVAGTSDRGSSPPMQNSWQRDFSGDAHAPPCRGR